MYFESDPTTASITSAEIFRNCCIQQWLYATLHRFLRSSGHRPQLLSQIKKTAKRENLLQIMHFQFEVLGCFHVGWAVTALHSLGISSIKSLQCFHSDIMAKRGYVSRVRWSNGHEERAAMHDRNNPTAWPRAAKRTKLTNQHTHTYMDHHKGLYSHYSNCSHWCLYCCSHMRI
jgi:hypothetical protein